MRKKTATKQTISSLQILILRLSSMDAGESHSFVPRRGGFKLDKVIDVAIIFNHT